MPVIFELFYLVWFILFLEQKKKTKTKLRKGGSLKEGGINRDSKKHAFKMVLSIFGNWSLQFVFIFSDTVQRAVCKMWRGWQSNSCPPTTLRPWRYPRGPHRQITQDAPRPSEKTIPAMNHGKKKYYERIFVE